jgi:RimJ/RimL family protein N-acetyltransferase
MVQKNSPTKVSIEKLVESDAKSLYELLLAQGSDLDAFDWRARIKSLDDEKAFIAWAKQAENEGRAYSRTIRVDGAIAGCASLYQPHAGAFGEASPDFQMGYWVGRRFRGTGASWRSMILLMDEVGEVLGPDASAGIRTRSRNGASLACAERLGLSEVGRARPSQFDPLDEDILLKGPLRRLKRTPSTMPSRRP